MTTALIRRDRTEARYSTTPPVFADFLCLSQAVILLFDVGVVSHIIKRFGCQNPKKQLYTVISPACGLLNKMKITERESMGGAPA